MPDSDEKQSIEQLQQRYQSLHEKKIRAEEQHGQAAKQLAELKQQAIEQYETDDLDQLREKLREMQARNEADRADYQKKLDAIDNELSDVEQRFAAGDASSNEAEAGEDT